MNVGVTVSCGRSRRQIEQCHFLLQRRRVALDHRIDRQVRLELVLGSLEAVVLQKRLIN